MTTHAAHLKPTHKAIRQYHESLQSYGEHGIEHEGALETAFQRLLDDTAKSHAWKLIPKLTLKFKKGHVIPDGQFQDEFNLVRGYWEAKDPGDRLDDEISDFVLSPEWGDRH